MAKFLLATLLLSSVFVAINCDCCGRTDIQYHSVSNYCSDIPGGFFSGIAGRCWIHVCGDGSNHPGIYCGKGPCNIFGCNCDGGCIPGNAIEEFKARYGDRVSDVQLM